MYHNVIRLFYGHLPNSASTYCAGASRVVFLIETYIRRTSLRRILYLKNDTI